MNHNSIEILLVEDDIIDAELATRELMKHNAQIKWNRSVKENKIRLQDKVYAGSYPNIFEREPRYTDVL